MALPSAQIDTWHNQGPISASSTTYQSIRTALEHANSPIAGMISSGTIKIDLQGSYAHDTNIRGDSDVDVMVQHTNTFHSNKASLPSDQYELHARCYPQASYNWSDLRRDVIAALVNYYGSENVDTTGNKSLKVLPALGRLRADVVPVISYRNYDYFKGDKDHSRIDGVALCHAITGEFIINYPDQHYKNAVDKHGLTNDRYKGMVRLLKNMRSYLIDKGRLRKDEAPSYFLQGMAYNVPNHLFVADRVDSVFEALKWLRNTDLENLVSQNEQHMLLGDTGEHWNPVSAEKTITELCYLWDNWGKL